MASSTSLTQQEARTHAFLHLAYGFAAILMINALLAASQYLSAHNQINWSELAIFAGMQAIIAVVLAIAQYLQHGPLPSGPATSSQELTALGIALSELILEATRRTGIDSSHLITTLPDSTASFPNGPTSFITQELPILPASPSSGVAAPSTPFSALAKACSPYTVRLTTFPPTLPSVQDENLLGQTTPVPSSEASSPVLPIPGSEQETLQTFASAQREQEEDTVPLVVAAHAKTQNLSH